MQKLPSLSRRLNLYYDMNTPLKQILKRNHTSTKAASVVFKYCFYIVQKLKLDISSESSAQQKIHMK